METENKPKTTTVYLNQDDRKLKQLIEEKLNGATLSHSSVYRKGLKSYAVELNICENT